MATVTFSAADDVLYAYLAGEIDHDAAQGLRIQLDDALLTRSPRILVMDLGGVGFMDSSGIGLILGRQRCARTLGGSLRIQHAPEQLRRVLQLASIPCTEPGGEVSGGISMKAENRAKIQFDSLSANEAFARGAAAAFLARYDPTVPQLADIKTAVSEAVTNCIVHAYPDAIGPVTLSIAVYPERLVKITVTDKGIGIPDVEKAMEPLFTTGNPEERSGLGFAVMQSFMDKVKVSSQPGKGTRVVLTKRLDERST